MGLGSYAIGYETFEGSIFEGHTLIPFLKRMVQRFGLNKPVMVANAGLLSKDNVSQLEAQGYEYILGARIKNESSTIVFVAGLKVKDGHVVKHSTEFTIQYLLGISETDLFHLFLQLLSQFVQKPVHMSTPA